MKGGFRAELRPIMEIGYQTEALFYRDLGSRVSAGLPDCYFSGVDPDAGQGIVIMNDLAADGAAFVDATAPISAEQVADGLATQVTAHRPGTTPGTTTGGTRCTDFSTP